EQHQIRLQPPAGGNRLLSGGSLSHHLVPVQRRDHRAQPLAGRRFVVDDEDSHGTALATCRQGRRSSTRYSPPSVEVVRLAALPKARTRRWRMLSWAIPSPGRCACDSGGNGLVTLSTSRPRSQRPSTRISLGSCRGSTP